MTGPRVALAVLAKDLRVDLRRGDRIGQMAFFAALVTVLLSLTLPTITIDTRSWLPPLIWIVFLLTSILGLTRSFQSEVQGDAGLALSQVPCDRGWVFLGKLGANFATLAAIELWTAGLFAVFLNVHWDRAPLGCAAVAMLGALGLSAAGTLFAAMAVRAQHHEFLLPLLLFPLMLPILVIASRAMARGLDGQDIGSGALGFLGVYAWVLLVIGFVVFDYVLEE
jgi:heme exporter protein B